MQFRQLNTGGFRLFSNRGCSKFLLNYFLPQQQTDSSTIQKPTGKENQDRRFSERWIPKKDTRESKKKCCQDSKTGGKNIHSEFPFCYSYLSGLLICWIVFMMGFIFGVGVA